MDLVVRAIVVYLFLLLLFRIAGQRSVAEISTFDFMLLLIVSEATQQAVIGQDYSLTGGLIVIGTYIALDIAFSLVKEYFRRFSKVIEGVPLILVENGTPLRDRMRRVQVQEDDILSAARELQGLERMEQIKYAVLEKHGGISIIPR